MLKEGGGKEMTEDETDYMYVYAYVCTCHSIYQNGYIITGEELNEKSRIFGLTQSKN